MLLVRYAGLGPVGPSWFYVDGVWNTAVSRLGHDPELTRATRAAARGLVQYSPNSPPSHVPLELDRWSADSGGGGMAPLCIDCLLPTRITTLTNFPW